MALHLPTGHLKTCSGLEVVPNVNPVPTSPLGDDLATVPLRLVVFPMNKFKEIIPKMVSSEVVDVLEFHFFVKINCSIGCVKSFVPLASQNGLSGVDHLHSPKAWHPLWY